MHILTKFYGDDVIHTKIMAILSTSTCGIFRFSIELETYRKKGTAVILKRIDKLPQNLARICNLVGHFDRSYKNVNFFILPIVSIVFHCLSIVRLLFQL